MKLFLIRHGTSMGNLFKSEYFEKLDSDIELAEKGEIDAKCAAANMIDLIEKIKSNSYYPHSAQEIFRFDMVYSTYKRATQTANIIFDTLQKSIIKIENKIPSPLCIEREWGSLRDIVTSKLKTDEHFNFYYRPVGGESFCDVYSRAVVFNQWLEKTANCDNIIVVAHGEFNRVLLMHLLNWDVEEFNKWSNQKNGEIWLVENGKLSDLTPLRPSKYSHKS